MMKTLHKIIFGTIVTTIIGTNAFANPPYYPDLVKNGNRWLITAYDDSSPLHAQWATQGICFYAAGTRGTHQLYNWVSDTFPDWNGRGVQEGDQIFMHGDYARDVGHDGMTWQLATVTPRDMGLGHWEEWREDGRLGRTIGFTNAKLVRVGKCERETYLEALEYAEKIELQVNKTGELIVTPNGFTESQLKELFEKYE